MKRPIYYLLSLAMLVSYGCRMRQKADALFYNATIYTVDDLFRVVEAFVIREGKIVETGALQDLVGKYKAGSTIDLQGRYVYPGFMDAHGHFKAFALNQKNVDLMGARSPNEVLTRAVAHHEKWGGESLLGTGWDQTLWHDKKFPTKKLLDSVFSSIPVALYRSGTHAVLVNSVVLTMAGIDADTKVEGGIVVLEKGEPSGVLIDNAMALVERLQIGKPTNAELYTLIQAAEEKCFAVGLTSVSDLGWLIDLKTIRFFDSLYRADALKIKNYVMPDASSEGLAYMQSDRPVRNGQQTVKAIKVIADGALGSYGACLLRPYTDNPATRGIMTVDYDSLRYYARMAYEKGFQLCVHAIGDSANRTVLDIFSNVLPKGNDRRWRIEHAQVVDPRDMPLFGEYNIIPSVQPTHATSDMEWADERLGDDRIKHAYALKQLLRQNGWLPLGSDFPVEPINPLLGFYAAVARKTTGGVPPGGFQTENALTRKQALKGMTIWAAKAQFEENEKGSLEAGKCADFVVLEVDIMTIPIDKVPHVKIMQTYIDGEKVFDNKR